MAAKIRIEGKVYKSRSLDDITLDDLIVFDDEAAEAGWAVTFDQIEAWADRLEVEHEPGCVPGCTEHSPLTRREGLILAAVTVWLVRRGAGEEITLKQAAKTPVTQIEEMPSTGDREPGPTKARKGGSKKKSSSRPPRRASAQAPATVKAAAAEADQLVT